MMKTLLKFSPILFLLMLFTPSARANQNAQGWCEVGSTLVVTSGLVSTTPVQGSFPLCTVTVFVHGGGLALIYSDNINTPLANPFTGALNGQWLFYASNGRYDIQLSGAGFPIPVVFSDVILADGGEVFSGNSPPVGTCSNGALYTVNPTGAVFSCAAGAWQLISGGGGGGGLADPGANGIVYRSSLNVTRVALPADFPILNQNTIGQANTALSFAVAPANCTFPQFSLGITPTGTANCSSLPTSSAAFPVTTAQQVQSGGSITPTGTGILQANQVVSTANCLPTVAGNVCYDSTNGGLTYGTLGSATASVLWATTRPASTGLCATSANLFGRITFIACPGLTNPMTLLGDTIFGASAGAPTRLAGPTVPAGVPQVYVENPTGGLATAPAWQLQGVTGNVISGATSTYTFCGAITGVGACTVLTDHLGFPEHDVAATAKVSLTLPTPTTLGIPNFVTRYCNNALPSPGAFDVVIPTTWTINGKSNWPVPQNSCVNISVDAFNANNWIAIPGGSAVLPIFNCMNYPGSAGHLNIQACNDAAVAAGGGIIDDRGDAGATETFSTEFEIGDHTGGTGTGIPVIVLLPAVGQWVSTVTGHTGCMFKQWHGATVLGTSPYRKGFIVGPFNASTDATSTWCTDAAGDYYYTSGFSISNKVVMVTGGYDVEVNGLVDGSWFRDMEVNHYVNKGIRVQHSCCHIDMNHIVADGNGTGKTNITFDATTGGVSNHGISWSGSFDHVAPGFPHVEIDDNFSPNHSTLDAGTLYLEPNLSGTETGPCININGAAVLDFTLIEGCQHANVHMNIANNGAPQVTVQGMSDGGSTSVVAISNNSTALCPSTPCQTFTDTLGHVGPFTTATINTNGVNILGSPVPRTIASGALTLNTTAVGSGACGTVQTATATGTLTTDHLVVNFNDDVTAITGYTPVTTGALTIFPYPTANTFNVKVCNLTTGSITPGAITLNWQVLR